MRKNTLLIIAISLIMTSCNETPTSHVYFIDCTNSTILSKSGMYANNFYKGFKNMIDKNVMAGETITIYPIHAQTLSAAKIGEWVMPMPKDINYKIQRRKMVESIISAVENKIEKMRPEVRSHTSIFPVFDKLKRVSNKDNMNVTIISDMIQDNSIMSFPNQFKSVNNKTVKKFAIQQYLQRKDDISIEGKHISILIPSTESGNSYGDSFNKKVNTFWEAFMKEAGVVLSIKDLS